MLVELAIAVVSVFLGGGLPMKNCRTLPSKIGKPTRLVQLAAENRIFLAYTDRHRLWDNGRTLYHRHGLSRSDTISRLCEVLAFTGTMKGLY
jgi:hypothetical protein